MLRETKRAPCRLLSTRLYTLPFLSLARAVGPGWVGRLSASPVGIRAWNLRARVSFI